MDEIVYVMMDAGLQPASSPSLMEVKVDIAMRRG